MEEPHKDAWFGRSNSAGAVTAALLSQSILQLPPVKCTCRSRNPRIVCAQIYACTLCELPTEGAEQLPSARRQPPRLTSPIHGLFRRLKCFTDIYLSYQSCIPCYSHIDPNRPRFTGVSQLTAPNTARRPTNAASVARHRRVPDLLYGPVKRPPLHTTERYHRARRPWRICR